MTNWIQRLMARMGIPAGASLAADLVVIDDFVDALETRLTADRAGYLDQLGPTNLPTDIDTLLTRLSAARAGYLDQLDFALQEAITAIPTTMVGTNNAAQATVLGALADAAAAGDPTASDTAMQYLKQIVNVLVGTDGIAAWTGGAAPANGVSLHEVVEKIYDDLATSNAGLQEQADVDVNITAINASETDVFDLSTGGTRYIVRSLRLKCADPGANTITVRLYELINGAPVEVDSFDITTDNFGTYYSLMDLFGVPHLAGDDIQVTVQAGAGGPYTVTGQYSHAIAI